MIKFVFRWAFRLLILAIVLGIGVLLLKDTIVKEITRQRLQRETGLQVQIGKMELGLLTPTITIQNLVLYNSSDFAGAVFLDVPDLHIEYNRGELPFEKLRLKLLRLNFREINIVENQKGHTNLVDVINKVAPQVLGTQPGSKDEDSFVFGGVDTLNLSVGKVRYLNLRNPKRNQEIQLGMQNEIVQNIRNEQDLTAVLMKVLLRSGITIYVDSPKKRPITQAAASSK